MSKRVFAYKCLYCGRLFNSEYIAQRHELACLENPKAKNCLDCKYCSKKYNLKLPTGEIVQLPYCIKYDKKCSRASSALCKSYSKKDFTN